MTCRTWTQNAYGPRSLRRILLTSKKSIGCKSGTRRPSMTKKPSPRSSETKARILDQVAALVKNRGAKPKSLYEFYQKAWPLVDTDHLRLNWHLGLMAEHLEALYRGQIRKLAINVPPGTSKSLMCSVMFPAWIWGEDPKVRFITTSYEVRLAARDAGKAKELCYTPW